MLITGATGFIGGHLLRLLADEGRRNDVVLLASRPLPGWRWMPDRRGADGLYAFTARDAAEAGAGALDTVIHLGAATPRTQAEAQDLSRSGANIRNTEYLIGQLPRPRRFVFASTIDVYGDQPCREDAAPRPATLYGAGKLYCEAMLASWAAQASDGHSLATLRIGHIYGPGEERYRKFIPETIRRLRAGQPPLLTTTGAEKRSFLHVEDCCRAILAIARSDDATGPLNVASAHARPIRDVAERLARIAQARRGSPVPVWSPGERAGVDQVMSVDRLFARHPLRERDMDEALAEEFDAFPDG